MIVAIDGPTGAVKSSVARQLAERVSFQHLIRVFSTAALLILPWNPIRMLAPPCGNISLSDHEVEANYTVFPAKFFIDGKDVVNLFVRIVCPMQLP